MIKWIGQHIVSLIARFRDDVYLENLAETTQDHVVGIDSDGKLYKQDRGTTDSFTVEDGDTTDVVISNGKHWKFVEGGGIDINWTDTSNGTSSDEYDLTFTLSKGLQDLLIDASHIIRGVAGSDILIQSSQDINLHLDYDQASTAGTHSFKITNGDGNTIFTVDEDGNIVTRGTITAQTAGGVTKYPSKGSAGNLLVDNAGAISTRPVSDLKTDLALAKADVGSGSVENKSSATIRGEIVDSDIPSLNASKVNAGTFDAARIPTLNQSTTGNAGTATALATARSINGVSFNGTSDITVTAAGSTLSDLVPVAKGGTGANNVGGARAALGVDAAGTDNSTNVTLTGTPDYITISGQQITRNQIDLTADVTGALPRANLATQNAYQYISFTGSATVPADGDWITVSANGISNHTWNTDLGSGGATVGSSTVTIPTGAICQGIIVPYDCVLVGYSSLIRSVGNYQSKVGLAVGVPTYNDFATFDCTLRAYNAADISAGPDSNYSQRPVRADYLSANHSMSAGHVIFPLIGSVSSNSRTVQWNCTLVLKTLLP